MGTVHARSLEPLPASGPDFGALGEEAEFVEVEPEAKQEILENKDVVVQHVHFDGLGRTKDDIIMYEIGGVFKAKNLVEVMRRSHEAREKLLRLGIFRQVDVLIDTCQGDNALPNGLDITFEVTELRRLTGSYNTMVGNNEGSMTDRGLSAEYSFPIWKTSHTVKWEGVWRELGCLARTVSFAVRKESGHSLKSSLSHAMVIDSRNPSILPRRGALLKVNQELAGYTGGDVSFIKEDFELQLNKQLILDSPVAQTQLREQGGLTRPGVLPAELKTSRLGRLGGGGGRCAGSTGSSWSRGELLESARGPGDYLGGEAYWAGGLHLYTPLPFRPGQGGFGELFRTHFFLNAGNLCNLNYGEGPRAHIRKLAECIRWSYGAGIVLRLGNIARLELNYCVPMGVQGGDRAKAEKGLVAQAECALEPSCTGSERSLAAPWLCGPGIIGGHWVSLCSRNPGAALGSPASTTCLPESLQGVEREQKPAPGVPGGWLGEDGRLTLGDPGVPFITSPWRRVRGGPGAGREPPGGAGVAQLGRPETAGGRARLETRGLF
ncbi:hypothetical protein J1605_020510 [Eschrichtius robustus]|uniref:POTRA domain-containing protein n=1 Tax=Eschrichtius robustus TaxID=9764 RepID=A0AB34HKW4_ESCRO|nr:hypothetical protein J1605_020510 [Eschrichtius robustus]